MRKKTMARDPYKPVTFEARKKPAAEASAPSPTLDLDATAGPEKVSELPSAPESGIEVPDGTIKEILAWVGDDTERAEAAADAENAAENPRPTLLDKLKKVVEG